MARRQVLPPPGNIARLWPFLAWLDDVWRRPIFEQGLIEGPVFRALAPADRLLTHWLCYICDRVERATLWAKAGPVFAELVSAYSDGASTIEILEEIASKKPGAKAFSYRTRTQLEDGEPISFTARLPAIVPIASTLLVLDRHERSLIRYLHRHWSFCHSGDAPEVMHRIGFLFDSLTYWDLGRASDPEGWQNRAQERAAKLNDALRNAAELENRFEYWRGHCFDHKRLWAALRDWIAPHSGFRSVLLEGLNSVGAVNVRQFIEANAIGLASGLEVPGDVWNSRFLKRMFRDVQKAGPREIREWYEGLNAQRIVDEGCWPSQFDISFVYSPNMCAGQRQDSCLFRRESRAWDLCPVRNKRIGTTWAGRPCPLVDHLCDFEYACEPNGCPVPHAQPEDICPGCQREITVNGSSTRTR